MKQLQDWLRRPKRGYSVVMRTDGIMLTIKIRRRFCSILVPICGGSGDWRSEVAFCLAQLRRSAKR